MIIPSLETTAFYAGVLIIMQFVFTMAVIRIRIGQQISLGDNNDPLLQKRIRSHANFVEVVPCTLVALALVEYLSGNTTLIHILGSIFVTARILHYMGINMRDKLILRQIGMLASLLVMLVAAIVLIMNSWVFS